ncbi:DUF262 domain-containing protein [Photobacterium phosphoreum]|uniref:DUF262 domain-containing protein n=1 Tax=Photobacterium phosphoreum TaxID=659 RepID=UPI001E478771|nr:DUF262 domain-containing protein [Photobacterium phosphoreum]MCD9475469.1 DUF262 domain-containing protein [Photobacterium phosphoreum]MCF2176067.1 DUF262 domain-containing protein [Photobacterium phosphoreum]
MQVEPDYNSVGALFRDANVFRVPEYQRGYAWEDEEINDFLEDFKKVLNNEGEHFFGCLVCAQDTEISGHEKINKLVDGQQRLTTFVIFAKCLIAQYKKYSNEDEFSEYIKEKIDELNSRYLYYKKSVNKKTMYIKRLELSRRDNDFFQAMMSGNETEECERDSHKRIKRGFKLIQDFFTENLSEGNISRKLDILDDIEDKLNKNCNVIQMVTSSVSDAYKLFQVINDRGRALNSTDLLRAKTLGIADNKKNEFIFKQVEKLWDDLDKSYGSSVERLLGHYYSSVTGKKVKSSAFYDQCMDDLFDKGRISPPNLLAKLKNISVQLSKLNKIASGEWPYSESTLGKWHHSRLDILINNLKHTHPIPLLLAASNIGEKDFSDVVRILEIFFFRYKYICGNKIDLATTRYLNTCKAIVNGKFELNQFKVELRKLIHEKANDELFSSRLEALEYSTLPGGDNKGIKYLLLGIEEFYRWYKDNCKGGVSGRTKYLDTSKVYDFKMMTIEHVYPRNPTIRDVELEGSINTIGNLTLLDPNLNTSLGNIPYESKLNYFIRDSRVLINKEFEIYPIWDKVNMMDRKSELINSAKSIFIF